MSGISGINEDRSQKPSENLGMQWGNALWFTKQLDACLETKERRSTNINKSGAFFASNLGSVCERFLYMHFYGMLTQEQISGNLKRIFDVGHSAEARFLRYFEKMRIYVDHEVPVRISNPPIHGRIDFVLRKKREEDNRLENFLLELKTINNLGFGNLNGPQHHHYVQLQVYLNIMGLDTGVVLYECKDNQRLKAFDVTRDQVLWEQILQRCQKVQNMIALPDIDIGEHDKRCKCS